MRLYRFKGDQNPEYALDIIRNRRLYCASWKELNDPMEGTYSTLLVDDPQHRKAARDAIYQQKVRLRVCSMTRTYKRHTMWAYYANGFSGVAIELELESPSIHEVDYASGIRIQTWEHDSDPYQIAKGILTKKHSDWRHEREMRLLHNNEFFPLTEANITGVILGSRIAPGFKQDVCAAAAGIPIRQLQMRSGELWAAPLVAE